MHQLAFHICTFIFQVLTFAAIVVAVVALWLQRRALKQQVLAQQDACCRSMIPTLILHLESPPVRAARDVVRDKLRDTPVDQWTDDERVAAGETLAAFDLAGALARNNEPVKDLVLVHWSHEITAICRACRPHIAARRAHEGCTFLRSLLWLEAEANRALADDFTATPVSVFATDPYIEAKPQIPVARPQDLAKSETRISPKSSRRRQRRNGDRRAA